MAQPQPQPQQDSPEPSDIPEAGLPEFASLLEEKSMDTPKPVEMDILTVNLSRAPTVEFDKTSSLRAHGIPKALSVAFSKSHGDPGGDLDAERHSKSLFMVIFTVCLALIFALGKLIPGWNVYHLFGIALCFTITVFVTANIAFILSFEELHFVRIRRRRYPKAKLVFLPYAFEEDEETIIYAISWLAALRGSNVASLVTTFLYSSSILMFAVASIRWMEHDDFVLSRDLHVILFIAGAYGIFSASTWNLERQDVKYSALMHQISVVFPVSACPLALMIQQHWSALSVVLGSVTFVVLLAWFVTVEVIDFMAIRFDKQDIHKVSLALLLTELSGLALVFAIAIWYTFDLAASHA